MANHIKQQGSAIPAAQPPQPPTPPWRLGLRGLVAMLLIALWGFAGYWSFTERRHVLVTKVEDLDKLAVAVEDQTLRLLKLTEASLLALGGWMADHPDTLPDDAPSFRALAEHHRRLTDGMLEIHTRPIDIPTQSHGEGALHTFDIGKPMQDAAGKWILPIHYLVPGKGQRLTLIIAELSLDRMAQTLDAQREKPDGSITLLKQSGDTLFRVPTLPGIQGGSIAHARDFQEHLRPRAAGHYQARGAYDGVERLISHRHLPGYPVIVAVTATLDDTLIHWRRDNALLWGLIFSITVVSLVLTKKFIDAEQSAHLKIVEERQRLRDLINSTDGIVWEADARSFDFTFVSEQAERLLGYAASEWREPGFWLSHLHPEDKSWAPEFCASCTGRLEAHDFEYRFIARDGRTVWLRDIVTVVSEAGQPRWLRGIMVDISAQKADAEKLQLAASVYANSQEGIVVTDADNVILDVNPAFTRLTGYPRGEVLGKTPRLLSSGRHSAGFYANMWQTLNSQGTWSGEIWNRRKSGEIYVEMLSIDAVKNADGRVKHYVGVFTDISRIKAHEAELDRITHYDSLTGVPNRRLLSDRLYQAIARTRRTGKLMAVCSLDIDGFKPVNESAGHAAGDRLLVELANRLQCELRADDTIARLGGDEFVLLLNEMADTNECLRILQRLLNTIGTPFEIDGLPLSITASIGVTLFPSDNADPDTLLRHADHAMYQAKAGGKNRFLLFDPDEDRQLRAHQDSMAALHGALENNEFVLHYQPKVDLHTGALIGAEALIRWQHPERGLLSPGEFLPTAEGTDLDVAIGEWVIQTALRQIAEWRGAGKPCGVSINISATHLLQPDFVHRLETFLADCPGARPSDLELEILETAAIGDIDQAAEVIHACQALGIRFALDDFGTGYATLSYFRRLPIALLKIDQSFVRSMLDDEEDFNIVESVVRLAQVFRCEVIAEGVETLEHCSALLRLGCHRAQGFGIARPMAAAALAAWHQDWQTRRPWETLPG